MQEEIDDSDPPLKRAPRARLIVAVFIVVAGALLVFLGLRQYESSRRAEDLLEQGMALADAITDLVGDDHGRLRSMAWNVAGEVRMAARDMALRPDDLNRMRDLIRRVRVAGAVEAKMQFLMQIRRIVEQNVDSSP